MTENIVHCVLARLPGAPAGTPGISLFLVPKRHLAGDKAGELNSLGTSRIEDKMGCHGSPVKHTPTLSGLCFYPPPPVL